MITRVPFNLTDDERRVITGGRRLATRKEIKEFVERLVAAALQRGDDGGLIASIREERGSSKQVAIEYASLNCTTLDHLYPLGPKTPDTPCFCGQKKWGAFTPVRVS